jgi:hypothetical protein
MECRLGKEHTRERMRMTARESGKQAVSYLRSGAYWQWYREHAHVKQVSKERTP